MAEFDFDAARRWARFDPQKTISRRNDAALPFVRANLLGGQGLLIDACVYIDQMQDRSPQGEKGYLWFTELASHAIGEFQIPGSLPDSCADE
jgi:hypothetical protein